MVKSSEIPGPETFSKDGSEVECNLRSLFVLSVTQKSHLVLSSFVCWEMLP
jgi:hypothetical protein